MKQQVLEQRLAEIEAVAANALKTGEYASAVVAIIKIVGRNKE